MRTVRIPRHLLHVELEDLRQLSVPEQARDALRALLADLPLVPDASFSALLVGPGSVTLPCLAVLARHVGQGLRDHNLSFAHDRARLSFERAKLIFMGGDELARVVVGGDERLTREAVLFVYGATPSAVDLLLEREALGLSSFVTAAGSIAELAHWRIVQL